MIGVAVHAPHGHLVRSPKALHLVTVHLLGPGPTLGGTQHDHGPAGPLQVTVNPGLSLDFLDFEDALLHHRRHRLVHGHGVAALHKVGGIAIPPEEGL